MPMMECFCCMSPVEARALAPCKRCGELICPECAGEGAGECPDCRGADGE